MFPHNAQQMLEIAKRSAKMGTNRASQDMVKRLIQEEHHFNADLTKLMRSIAAYQSALENVQNVHLNEGNEAPGVTQHQISQQLIHNIEDAEMCLLLVQQNLQTFVRDLK